MLTMRPLRISTSRATHQHFLGGRGHTIITWTAVLWTHEPHRPSQGARVLREATGLDRTDAVINLVRSWRLPC